MKDYSMFEKTDSVFSGSEKKHEILISGQRYIVKFQKNSEVGLTMSYVCEYLGSHIFQLLGIEAQQTFLGTCEGRNVVVMKNFLDKNEIFVAFNGVGESTLEREKELYQYTYDDICSMLEENTKLTNVQQTVDRFWDMFIVDALIGNFDRHGSNWGFIKKENKYRIAPVFDNGSCLYPRINNDKKILDILNDESEILKRIYQFPRSHIKVKGRKSSYFEVINSLQFEQCNKALKRIVPKVHLEDFYDLIDSVECISNLQKEFYKTMIKRRFELILQNSYQKLKEKNDEACI
ncbi:MAG: HipA domain-containing protein [Erysipelotrichaceae bacterium]|nr:HipA domain-containing protein [Erysipelotrichaceae bacterium]